ncbi:MAG TPA: hypothetical protein VGO37_02965 [Steroidobacteraceae bacterium]|nr:hypothetical protein [Steroidobacteraceae bacterium]
MHVHQILNHYTSRQELDPGFEVLDNSANERPDWFEYWPIRKFLLNETLDEDAFYGFLSPKFKVKTSLDSEAVREFIQACDAGAEVIVLSPSIHNSAYYLNVFEHGDAEHPGLKKIAGALFERLGFSADLDSLVSDSRNTVHSNYFIAKPRFWRAWLAINEKMFAIAESASDALGEALRTPTRYRGAANVQMKIFVMERMATWLLTTDRSFEVRVRDPFVAHSRLYKLPVAVVCDALKIAYATQGRSQYKDVFLMVRGLRKILNLHIRLGGALGFRHVGSTLRILKSYWLHDGR